MLFYSLIVLVILQRITELYISIKNEKWLRRNGAIEYGQRHYKLIVLLHSLFFISLILEYNFSGRYSDLNVINYLFLVFFILLQIMRIWVLRTLGNYWNTKIFRIPGSELIAAGPYKYFKHPNYIVVICEIFSLPLIFDLYYTAVIFSFLNALVLFIRIREENRILKF